MTKTFNFELVSPEEKLISESVWQVTIPGEEGDFSVRANHSALVSSIRVGTVIVKSSPDAAPRHIKIDGGFADVSATQCTILAEQAEEI